MDKFYKILIFIYIGLLLWWYIQFRKFKFNQKTKTIKLRILLLYAILISSIQGINDVVDREFASMSVGCLESLDDWWKNPTRFATMSQSQFNRLNSCGYVKTFMVLASMLAWAKLAKEKTLEQFSLFLAKMKNNDWSTPESFFKFNDILLENLGLEKNLSLTHVFVPM